MNDTFRIFLSTILTLTFSTATLGQIALTSSSTATSINFEDPVPGVVEGPFDGTGFLPLPSGGQMDSDAWQVFGFSDGDLVFGGTALTGDLARGAISGGGTSTGGIYALADFPDPGGRAIAVQPGGSDATPGSITLKVRNEDLSDTLTQLTVSYDIYERNDADRSTFLGFSYSSDNVTYSPVSALDHATPELADMSPVYAKVGGPGPSKVVEISFLSVPPNGGEFYLRWETDDFSGSGSRDEIAIDNVSVSATFLGTTAAAGSIVGKVTGQKGLPIAQIEIVLTSADGSFSRSTRSNGFGSFEFRDIPLGETYSLRAVSRRYIFKNPIVIVNAYDSVTSVHFWGMFIRKRWFGR